MDQTIRALAIGKRCLPRVTVSWQRLAYDVFQLNFPKGTARLLVAQDILQAQHIA